MNFETILRQLVEVAENEKNQFDDQNAWTEQSAQTNVPHPESWDIAEVALWLAKDEYPQLMIEDYLSKLAYFASEIKSQVVGSLQEKVSILSQYLFEKIGFQGNKDNYYDPLNSYLNEVIDRKLGIPISLSVIVMRVARGVGLEVRGVALPGHFILKAIQGEESVLFDPFNKGKILDVDQCEQLLESAIGYRLELTPDLLVPAATRLIISRMLNNLKSIYVEKKDYPRASRVIDRLCTLHPQDYGQKRDLGIIYYQCQQFGKAIDPLQAYIKQFPDASDASDVKKLIHLAKQNLQMWN